MSGYVEGYQGCLWCVFFSSCLESHGRRNPPLDRLVFWNGLKMFFEMKLPGYGNNEATRIFNEATRIVWITPYMNIYIYTLRPQNHER